MKKFLRVVCDTCFRFTDQQVDNTRVSIDKCVITLGCKGKLQPAAYVSNTQITPAPKVGVSDWVPRNFQASERVGVSGEEKLIDTSTGEVQQLVLAVSLTGQPSDSSTVMLTLAARSNEPKNYRQYTYSFDTEFTTVSGIESGLAKKSLFFSVAGADPDLVEVYVNGVKKHRGQGAEDYKLYDPNDTFSQTVPQNTIVFNNKITPDFTTQVDVIVSKSAQLNTTQLTFYRNKDDPSRVKTGSWENASAVQRFAGGAQSAKTFWLYTCDIGDVTNISLNSILYPTGTLTLNSTQQVSLSDAQLLFAKKPYSTLDRYVDIYCQLTDLAQDTNYLKYHVVNGIPALEVTESSLTTSYPPAKVLKFNTESTIKSALAGVEDQLVIDGKLVIGPDR